MTVQRRTSPHLLAGTLLVLLLIAIALLLSAPAWSAGATDPDAIRMAIDPSLSPVEARRLRFLFWGYAAIWALLGGYLVSLGLRLRTVRAEIGRVRARLEKPPARNGAV